VPGKPPPRSTRLKSERVQGTLREPLAWSLGEEAPLRLTLRFSSPQIGLLVTAIAASSAAVAGFEPEITYRRGEVAVSIGSPGAVTEGDLARARALASLLTGMLEGMGEGPPGTGEAAAEPPTIAGKPGEDAGHGEPNPGKHAVGASTAETEDGGE
jgi:pterin-4a-carbinolamine dehydratase